MRLAKKRTEACARVYNSRPPVGEPPSLELRKCGEEVARKLPVCLWAILILALDAPADLVDSVVPSPQDPIVNGKARIVKLIGHLGQAFAAFPANRIELLGRQKLRHKDIVVHGDRVETKALK